jgi:hypothetical protein
MVKTSIVRASAYEGESARGVRFALVKSLHKHNVTATAKSSPSVSSETGHRRVFFSFLLKEISFVGPLTIDLFRWWRNLLLEFRISSLGPES